MPPTLMPNAPRGSAVGVGAAALLAKNWIWLTSPMTQGTSTLTCPQRSRPPESSASRSSLPLPREKLTGGIPPALNRSGEHSVAGPDVHREARDKPGDGRVLAPDGGAEAGDDPHFRQRGWRQRMGGGSSCGVGGGGGAGGGGGSCGVGGGGGGAGAGARRGGWGGSTWNATKRANRQITVWQFHDGKALVFHGGSPLASDNSASAA